MTQDITQFVLILAIMTGLVVVLGKWMTHLFTSSGHNVVERGTYAILGVDPAERMSWKRYGMVLLLSNAAMMLLGYLILRLQEYLPGDSLARASQTPDLAFNTAASFITNTNWQSYSGESSLSNFSQMAVITFLMTVSAATGVAAAGWLYSWVKPQKCSRHRQLLGRLYPRHLSPASAALLRHGARLCLAGHAADAGR